MKKKYVFREKSRITGDATVVGQELEAIRKRNGDVLRPDDVVRESKKVKAPLHDQFEWNDAEAGHEYRLIQARTLIRSVQVIRSKDKEPVSQFVHVRMNPIKESYYQDMNTVARSPDEYELALAEALSRLYGAQRAVEELRECAKRHKKKDEKGIGAALNGVISATHKLQEIQDGASV